MPSVMGGIEWRSFRNSLNKSDRNQFDEMFSVAHLYNSAFTHLPVYWSDVMTKPDDPSSIDRSHMFTKKMKDTPKVVFTKTLKKSQWANTDIAADLTDEIIKLKSLKGKDMIVYGGASFDTSLIRAGLIDEFHLLINPVAIENGMTIFKDLNKIQKFMLIKSISFDYGIIGLRYEPKKV